MTSDERDNRFLELVAGGMRRDQAAAEVGKTGTQYRARIRRDPAFAARYREAAGHRQDMIEGEVLDEYLDRMFDRSDPQSARLLVKYAEAVLPVFDYVRKKRHEVTGGVLHGHFDLDRLTEDELLALREIVAKAQPDDSNVIDLPVRATS